MRSFLLQLTQQVLLSHEAGLPLSSLAGELTGADGRCLVYKAYTPPSSIPEPSFIVNFDITKSPIAVNALKFNPETLGRMEKATMGPAPKRGTSATNEPKEICESSRRRTWMLSETLEAASAVSQDFCSGKQIMLATCNGIVGKYEMELAGRFQVERGKSELRVKILNEYLSMKLGKKMGDMY